MAATARFKLIFYVPLSALEACKSAIFAAGAGRYTGAGVDNGGTGVDNGGMGVDARAGVYTECCFTSVGTGQFRPGDAAKPHIGTPGKVEEVQEARVETLCVGEDVVKGAVLALKRAHPYEVAAYEVVKIEDY